MVPSDQPQTAEPEKTLRVQTLGGFRVWRDGAEVPAGAWNREKALHLFQLLVTLRRQSTRFHKEQIIDLLWPEFDAARGDRDFKVALNALHKAIEPERAPRADPYFLRRHELTYGLYFEAIQIDADAFEQAVAAGNRALETDDARAIDHFRAALDLYHGDYLPARRYEDWSSAERERLQVLALNAMTSLAHLLLTRVPQESIRLTERVLSVDPIWEDAYRIQMRAYAAQATAPWRCGSISAAWRLWSGSWPFPRCGRPRSFTRRFAREPL
ncbi:MAG: transcriptional regulator [Caldilineaceae bacterium]|nr:transcriptional regulator [Caldilineaceae bacterium]